MCDVELKIGVYLNEVSLLWGCIDCRAYGNNYCYIQLFYGQTDYEAHLQPGLLLRTAVVCFGAALPSPMRVHVVIN